VVAKSLDSHGILGRPEAYMLPTNETGSAPKDPPSSDMRYVLIDIERQRKLNDRWRFRIGKGTATLILLLFLIWKGLSFQDLQTVLHWLRSVF
jgi:hypothetical protein